MTPDRIPHGIESLRIELPSWAFGNSGTRFKVFAQAGVPGLTIGPGLDQLEGGVEGGTAARADYFANRYHQPGDEFSDAWDMRGPVADTTTTFHLIRRIADSKAWPTWNEDSAFRSLRQTSDAARK